MLGQQVWTFTAGSNPGDYSGTFNFISNGAVPGCPGGNSEVQQVSEISQGANPYNDVLRICHSDASGAPPVFNGDSTPCENERRLGLPAATTAKHSLSDYLVRITGGKCVATGPRTVNIKFRDDYSVPGAPGIGDPVETVRFYDRTKHDKGYDINDPVDVPGSDTSGNFSFDSLTLKGLYVKIVMTTASGKVYTADTRHLPKSMLPHQFPQLCKKKKFN